MTPSTITIVAIAILVFILTAMFFYYNNKEIALRKEAEFQRGKIESVHDKMWKVIKQKANVSEQYRESFERVYPEIISGRYRNDNGSAMKWISEANPHFDTILYQDLMQAIEVQREYLHVSQSRMLDIINQRAALIESYPDRWFVQNKTPIEYEVISSTKTKTVIDTRIDDDVSLFS